MGWGGEGGAGEALKARLDARSLEWVVQEGSLQTGGPSEMNRVNTRPRMVERGGLTARTL